MTGDRLVRQAAGSPAGHDRKESFNGLGDGEAMFVRDLDGMLARLRRAG